MTRIAFCSGALALGLAAVAQQEPSPSGVRELFYAGVSAREKLPPIQTKARPARAPAAPRKQAPREETAAVVPAAYTGARNLGLRYNLVLVDRQTGASQTVSSTRNFVKGECFAIDIESNRSGYLYVLAKQSSGDWMPLFPSAQMTGETNVINPGEKVRVPARYCFEIADPPGTEKLFVALARDPGEVTDLNEGIGPQKPGAMLLANAHLVNDAVARMSTATYNRDIVIREIGPPASAREAANSVYVVNASDKPASRVVAEILVNHR